MNSEHFLPQPGDEVNDWQRLANSMGGVGPATVLDIAAIPVGIYGAMDLDSWKGIGASMAAFAVDFVDGRLSRKTKTVNELGEKVDAVGDKLRLALFLNQIWTEDLAPKPLVSAVATEHSLNMAITGVDRITGKKAIHASKPGKAAIFTQQLGLGLHVIGSKIKQEHEDTGNAVKRLGTVVTLGGLAVGAKATVGYGGTLIKSLRSRKQ